ncbi:MAG: ComEC/Rec2 family competence protein, partial [Planctomycetota bacterium]|nr:ComEC/Rec2 family competence protein [Planctomycetota bacterium]
TPGVFRRALRFFMRWLVIGFARSAAVWVGMCAITAYYFNVFTPIAVIANILLSPVMFVLLGASLLTSVASLLWLAPVADLFGMVASWSGAVIGRLASVLAGIPGLSFYLPSPSLVTVFAFFAAMAGLAAIRTVRRAALVAAVSGAVFVALAARDYCLPSKHDDLVRVTVLDVGHGLSVLVETGSGFTMLYDVGGSRSGDVGRNIVAPYVWTRKMRSVDTLALSHPDDDHINGFASFARRLGIEQLCVSRAFGRELPDIARRLGVSQVSLEDIDTGLTSIGSPVKVTLCGSAGDPERKGGERIAATLDILWPDDRIIGDAALSENDRSLVVKVSFGGRSVLLTGDLELRGLKLLCKSGADLRADVLVVPHHGSAGSLCVEFIEAVKPSVVVVSRRKRAGDAQSMLRVFAAYWERGARVADTSKSGAVTVRLARNGDIEVSTFVEEEGP